MTTTRKDNRSGSIYFDEKRNKWKASITWTDKAGKVHRKQFQGDKKSVVSNKLTEFKRNMCISEGNTREATILFQEFALNWLENTLRHSLKPSSYMRKLVTFQKQVFPIIGDYPIDSITHNDVQFMVNELSSRGLSYSTIKKAYEAVNGCMREFRIKSGSNLNPCEGVTLPENKRKSVSDIRFFDEEQRALICKEAIRRYGTGVPVYRLGYAIILLMYSGMRIGEAIALEWSDIDFVNKTIKITKNAVFINYDDGESSKYRVINQNSAKTQSGKRIIPMTEKAFDALINLKKLNGKFKYVLSTSNGSQCTPRNFDRMFRGILRQIGIADCGVHTLRHTFASMLFNNGCSVKVVSDLLGHSDTKITENIYIHLLNEQKIKAIENIDKFSD